MSNQYPGGYNSPLGGHRGQFNSPQHQQQQQMMSQMGPNSMEVSQGGGNPMMPMGGYGTVTGPGGMMAQQQGMGVGVGVGVGQMNPVGMQSPSHMQQAQQQQQQAPQMMPMQQQMQMQHQQQQQQMVGSGGSGGMSQHMGGMMGQNVQTGVVQQPNMVTSHIPQQQQHMSPHHMQTTTVPQPQGSGQLSMPPQQQQQQQQSHQQQQNITPQQSQQQSSTGGNTTTMSQANPHKEINIVQLSRLGQETVQDITSRFQEVLSVLKIIQPTQNRDNNTEKKVQEHFRTIRLLFKRVRIIFEKCNDGYPQGIEYAHVESLIPMKDEPDPRFEGAHCDEYRKVSQENQELVETVKLKNRQLREIIDRTRIIIWEINTMLAMRRS